MFKRSSVLASREMEIGLYLVSVLFWVPASAESQTSVVSPYLGTTFTWTRSSTVVLARARTDVAAHAQSTRRENNWNTFGVSWLQTAGQGLKPKASKHSATATSSEIYYCVTLRKRARFIGLQTDGRSNKWKPYSDDMKVGMISG